MAFDQNITYKVNVDDSNFQSKLTQMRASMDSSLGGGGGGGFSSNMMYGMMGVMGGGQGYGGGGGGMSDFGSQIRPVTYTPPAIAMQPHFGMFQIQQTLSQAGLGSMGPMGAGVSGALTNLSRGGFGGLITGPNAIPNNVTAADYMAMSARGFGDRLGDSAAISGLTAASTGLQLATGGAGYAAGSSLFAGGVGGFFGGMAGASIATLPVTMAVGKVTDMMADNRSLQTSLGAGSFRFMTGSGGEIDQLTGRGMSRKSRFDVASSIQGMEMHDMRFGMDEYKQALEGGMQFDMFSGTRDVEDFKGKFKGLVENLKTVTATLHTSLKEGIEVIRGFRDMGVTDPGEVNRLTMGSEMRGRASGRTGMEMMAIGQAGAEMFRGTGISMERGFELNQMNATSVRGMLNSGTLSREMVAQAGGENSLAQQMTASALSSFQTAHGRAAMMANFNPATGTMNPDMMANLAGSSAMNQIAGAAGMGSAALMKFQAHQEDLISSMSPQQMQLFGISTAMGTARMVSQGTGADMDTSLRISMQNMGWSKAVIEGNMGLLHQDPAKMEADMNASVGNMRQQAGMEDLRNRWNIGKAISNKWSQAMAGPAHLLGSLSEGVGESWENLTMKMSGQSVADSTMTGAGITARARAMVGDKEPGSVVDVRGSGLAGMLGYGQSGDALAQEIIAGGTYNEESQTYSYKGATISQFKDMASAQAAAASSHQNMSIAGKGKGGLIAVTTKNVQEMEGFSKSRGTTSEDTAAVEKEGVRKDIVARLYEAGEGATLDQTLESIAGVSSKDFALEDKVFEKKLGRSKSRVAAEVNKYFSKYGDLTPNAAKNWQTDTGTSSLADQSAEARAKFSDDARKDAKSLIAMMPHRGSLLGGPKLTDAGGQLVDSNEYLDQHTEALAVLADPMLSEAEKYQQFKEVSGLKGDVRGFIHSVEEQFKGSKGQEMRAVAGKMLREVKASGDMAAAAGGGASGKAMGDISADTTKVLEAQSAQLLTNYKQLIALQEQLNKAMKGK